MPKVASYYAVQPDAPAGQEAQINYLIDRVRLLEERLDDVMDIMTKVNHTAPERPTPGRLALADGTDWNPVGGSGLGWAWWDGSIWKRL